MPPLVPQSLYLGGKMRGEPLYNFPAFFAAAMTLREQGFDVWNPAEYEMANGFNPCRPLEEQGFDLTKAMDMDFEKIRKQEAVALLPLWEESLGASTEAVYAQAIGKPIFQWQPVEEKLVELDLPKPTITFGESPKSRRTHNDIAELIRVALRATGAPYFPDVAIYEASAAYDGWTDPEVYAVNQAAQIRNRHRHVARSAYGSGEEAVS